MADATQTSTYLWSPIQIPSKWAMEFWYHPSYFWEKKAQVSGKKDTCPKVKKQNLSWGALCLSFSLIGIASWPSKTFKEWVKLGGGANAEILKGLSNFYFTFWLHCMACGILVPPPGIEPTPPVVEARSLNHWTTREVLDFWIRIALSGKGEDVPPVFTR